jgi:hypothetical protein
MAPPRHGRLRSRSRNRLCVVAEAVRVQVHELAAVGDAEFAERLGEVVAHGPWAEEQLRADLPVASPFGGEPDDLKLLRGEAGRRGRGRPEQRLPAGAQFRRRAVGPGRRVETGEGVVGGEEVGAGIGTAPPAT